MDELQQNQDAKPSYWTSIFLAAAVFAVISVAAQILQGYMTISAGSQLRWFGTVLCIFISFAGLLAVWHYVNEYYVVVTLGKGALIGFLAGCLAQLIGIALFELWQVINPHFADSLTQVRITAIQNSDQIPDNYKEKSIQYILNPNVLFTVLSYFVQVIIVGIVSLLTGMIGVKLFSPKVSTKHG